MLNSVLNEQVSDTTEDASSYTDSYITIFLKNLSIVIKMQLELAVPAYQSIHSLFSIIPLSPAHPATPASYPTPSWQKDKAE